MSESGHRRPRVATCEEWDEDAQTILPGSRTTANISAKLSDQDLVPRKQNKHNFYADGGDSGYASRATTTVSNATTSSHRRMSDLMVDTGGIPERERNPYHFTQTAELKPLMGRQSSSQSKEPSLEKRSTRSRDDHGHRPPPSPQTKHPEPKKSSRPTHPPLSPINTRMSPTKTAKDDQPMPMKVRRSSSSQQPRPVSMAPPNSALPVQYTVYPTYGPGPVPTSGYTTPVTPSIPYGAIPFSYAPPPTLPTPSYAPLLQHPSYFDPLPEPHSARPSRQPSPIRRSTMYGEPVIRQSHLEHGPGTLERMPSRESRPTMASHKSARSIEIDRSSMPPPPRPQHSDTVPTRRPSNRRSQTYHPQEPTARERVVFETDRYDSDDDRDYHAVRGAPPTSFRECRESSTRPPPSSYRPLATAEARDRPPARKAVSYSAGTTVTKVANSAPQSMPRRMTVPLEQKEAEAEDYQSKRHSAAIASGLTTEALRKLDQRTSSSKSETGSNFSHPSSKSKDSSGRDRSQTTGGAKTSITLPGGMNLTIPADYMKQDGRPLSINVGGVVFSVAPDDKENERAREQKRIERAPSIVSRTSKKSTASSQMSSREVRGREMPPTATRHSQLEERGPFLKTSRQTSRAPSMNRRSQDYSSRRQSVDFSREYAEFYARE